MAIKITPELTLESLQKRNANTMSEWLGIEFTEFSEDYLIAKMPVDHRTTQPLGIVNGGAFCALAETVGSLAANLSIDRNNFVAIGLDINANHIRSAKEGFVYGKAMPLHVGKTTHVWEIKITDEQNRLCCISRLTMTIVEIKK